MQSITTVATISSLLAAVIIMVGICFAVQIGYKLAMRKKRYMHIIFTTCDVLL